MDDVRTRADDCFKIGVTGGFVSLVFSLSVLFVAYFRSHPLLGWPHLTWQTLHTPFVWNLSPTDLNALSIAAVALAFAAISFGTSAAAYIIACAQYGEMQRQTKLLVEQRDIAQRSYEWMQQHPAGDVHLTLWGGK